MSDYTVDTDDPGKAAQVVWAASLLFARTSSFNAENAIRLSQGYAMAYSDNAYEQEVQDAIKAVSGEAKEKR